jgi:hypothetical protein
MAGMVAVPSHLFVVAPAAAARHFLWLAPTPIITFIFSRKTVDEAGIF